jgi:hypothetical protein
MARTKGVGPVATSVERANKSLSDLMARGGRPFNLKLSPEGNAALKFIVEIEGHKAETAAINATLIERSLYLKSKQDKSKE